MIFIYFTNYPNLCLDSVLQIRRDNWDNSGIINLGINIYIPP